ncbi:hypothetical protein D3C76_1753270 [compost metagenome]
MSRRDQRRSGTEITLMPVLAVGLVARPGFDWVNRTTVWGVSAGGKAKSRSPGLPRVTCR